jgi:vacuolar-type H+-ATPase subunit E/Vma4
VTVREGSSESAGGIRAPAATADPREPLDATHADEAGVAELCERLRQLAHRGGEEALSAGRQRAEALVTEARDRAQAEAQAEIARVTERLARQRERELQTARLEARATVAWCRWKELDAVVDAAERHVQSLRDTEPERYLDALRRFVDSARGVLAGRALAVRAHPADLARLPSSSDRARDNSETIQVADARIQAGLFVTSTDGNVLIDETMAGRRKRLDELLRLSAAEVLFGTSAQGSEQAGADKR